MQIPNSDNIRVAADMLKTANPIGLADQQKELHEALGDKSDDFKAGYQLGLQTARVFLFGSAELLQNHVDLDKVL